MKNSEGGGVGGEKGGRDERRRLEKEGRKGRDRKRSLEREERLVQPRSCRRRCRKRSGIPSGRNRHGAGTPRSYVPCTHAGERTIARREIRLSIAATSSLVLLPHRPCEKKECIQVCRRTVLGCATLISTLSKARGGTPEPAPPSPLDVAVPLFSPYRYVTLLVYVRSGDHLRWRVFDLLNRKCHSCYVYVCLYSDDAGAS